MGKRENGADSGFLGTKLEDRCFSSAFSLPCVWLCSAVKKGPQTFFFLKSMLAHETKLYTAFTSPEWLSWPSPDIQHPNWDAAECQWFVSNGNTNCSHFVQLFSHLVFLNFPHPQCKSKHHQKSCTGKHHSTPDNQYVSSEKSISFFCGSHRAGLCAKKTSCKIKRFLCFFLFCLLCYSLLTKIILNKKRLIKP